MPSDRTNRPHGTFTPAASVSRALRKAGYHPFQVRNSFGLGGYRCRWDKFRQDVTVHYWPGDDVRAEDRDTERQRMLGEFERVLKQTYEVRRHDGMLSVRVTPTDTEGER